MHRLICTAIAAAWLLQPTVGKAQEVDHEPSILQRLILDINRLLDERDRRFAEEWADRWRYYEVTVSFSAEGNAYEISSQFACEPYIHGYNASNVRYRRHGDFPAQQLPSGAALVFGVPFLCADRYGWERTPDGHLMPTVDLDPGYVPLAIWLNDAQSPSRAEIYISEWYYEDNTSRLSIPHITVRGTPEHTPTDNGNAVVDISLQRGVPKLAGMYATVIPSNIWSTIPEVATLLEATEAPITFPYELSSLITRSSFWIWSQGNTRQALDFGVPTPSSRFSPNELLREASRRVIPVLHQNDAFEFDNSTRGTILMEEELPATRRIDVQIGEELIDYPVGGYWAFEPNSGLLFAIQVQILYMPESTQ